MNTMKKILIAGGSGFIGTYLANFLGQKGYTVSLLSRKAAKSSRYQEYVWNPENGELDPAVLKEQDVIINLSGAGIANRYWTKKRKQVLYHSRLDSTSLLVRRLSELKNLPSLFINASAIGYYGHRPGEILNEESPPGSDFISRLCMDWENAAKKLRVSGCQTVILRIGIVLGKQGGSLAKFAFPLKFGLNVSFDKGNQMISWIHILDLAAMVDQLIKGNLVPDVYNAVAPNPIPQHKFHAEILHALHRRAFKIRIPQSFLKLVLGDMATIFISDQNIQCKKLLEQNFSFEFPDIRQAIIHLIG